MKRAIKQPAGRSNPAMGGTMKSEDLPAPVREALRSVACDFRKQGIDLILFGSFAKGRAWPTSDLDIAFSGAVDRQTEQMLTQRIQELPTIRPVDLVPLSKASPSLANEIRQTGVLLANL